MRTSLCLLLLFSFTICKGYNSTDTAAVAPAKINPAKPPYVKYFSSAQAEQTDSVALTVVDTSLSGFQNYNPAFKDERFYKYLGNYGSAAQNLVYSPGFSLEPNLGFHARDLYTFTKDDIRYYDAKKRYTEITYVSGNKKEGTIELTHSQNILAGWNAGIILRRMTIEGYLAHQYTYSNNLVVFSSFRSRNKKYNVFVNAIYNKTTNSENGGVYSEQEFETTHDLSVNVLTRLRSAQNDLGSRSAQILQFYDFKRKDSTNKAHPYLRFGHELNYQRIGFSYRDDPALESPLFKYYASDYFPGQPSLDTTGMETMSNRVFLSLMGANHFDKVGVEAGLETSSFHQMIYDSSMVNYFAGFSLRKRIGFLRFEGDLRYIVKGQQANSYSGNGLLALKIKPFEISGGLHAMDKPVDLIVNRYYSSHFMWNNHFNNTIIAAPFVAINLERFHTGIKASLFTIKNYTGWDFEALPYQLSVPVNVYQIDLRKDFYLGKWSLFNHVVCQKSNPDAVRVPAIMTYNSLQYTNTLFKKALLLQLGTSIRYYSEYYSDAYMPATGQFYLQDGNLLGNYPFMELFVNFKIKNVRFFVKSEHVNKGLWGATSNQYYLPNYPISNLTIKFGLCWKFFD